MLNYTLGFVKYKNEILLLNREYPGWMGCFNGIGGGLEEGETPFEGIKRELREETNLESDKIKLCGFVTWEKHIHRSGAYIFLIEIDEKPFDDPLVFEEGILVWKDLAWITHPENRGIAQNVLPYIEQLFDNEKQLHFKTNWQGNDFIGVDIIETEDKVEYQTFFKVTPVDYKELAIKKLMAKKYQNTNAMHFLQNNCFKDVHVIGNSVIMRLNNDGVFIFWDRKLSFNYINQILTDDDYKFYMIEKRVKDELGKTRNQKYLSLSKQYYIEKYERIDSAYEVVEIKEESVDFILSHMEYKLGYSKELLLERIRKGYTSAIYKGDELIAWVYQHDDGSVGGLNVLKEYRGKGYAKAVCDHILSKIIADQGFAICQIEESNEISTNLFKKLGFVESHEICWVGYHK